MRPPPTQVGQGRTHYYLTLRGNEYTLSVPDQGPIYLGTGFVSLMEDVRWNKHYFLINVDGARPAYPEEIYNQLQITGPEFDAIQTWIETRYSGLEPNEFLRKAGF